MSWLAALRRRLPRRPAPPPAEGPSPVAVQRADLLALQPLAARLALGQRRPPGRTRVGLHTARIRGRGLDFEEVRPYQPGDDLRLVEWKVTARTGRPYTKVFREERERPLHLVVDFRRSMRFGTRSLFKSVLAARVATLLAWVAIHDGDRVALTVATDRGHVDLPAVGGKRGILRLIRVLAETHATEPDPEVEPPGLAPLFEHLLRRVSTGTALVPVGDFQGLDDNAHRLLGLLARRTDLFGVFIYDPMETEAPPAARYPVTDGVRRGVLDFTDPAYRHHHHARFEARAEAVRAAFVERGAHLLRLSTEHDPGDSVRRLLHARGKGGRG
ncbi:MAG: DUF58 domain-containing protein [Thiohalospira sp.]